MAIRFYFLLFVFSLGLGIQAKAFVVPSLTGPVVDQAGLLSTSTHRQLTQVLQQTHRNKGPQVQVLIVSSLDGLSIEQAAIQVFDQWKLGTEKEDNGVLFLIAPNEKKLRIEVGRGLEGDIPDVIAKRIISDVVRPFFKRGEFNAGVVHGVQAILYYGKIQVEQGTIQAEERDRPSEKSGPNSWIIFVIIGFWILLFIFNPSLALALLFSGRGGGGRGGGGGWSGGGGSSAGGGASGDW